MKSTTRSRGGTAISLLELLIVIAIFAVVLVLVLDCAAGIGWLT